MDLPEAACQVGSGSGYGRNISDGIVLCYSGLRRRFQGECLVELVFGCY